MALCYHCLWQISNVWHYFKRTKDYNIFNSFLYYFRYTNNDTISGLVTLWWSGSTMTQITVHKKNWWIRNKSGIISSFDVSWSEWSWITDPDPDRPKGTHTKVKASNLENPSENESLIFLSHSKKFTRWIEEQIFSGTRWEKSTQEERISYATKTQCFY